MHARNRNMALYIAALSFAAATFAQEPATKPKKKIDRRAAQALEAMSQLLGRAPSLRFHSSDTINVVEREQKLQFGRELDVVIKRPRHIRAVTTGDLKDVSYWFDGKTLTLVDTSNDVWTAADGEKDIDRMLDKMTSLGLILPLADLLRADPAAGLLKDVRSGRYVGLHRVAGVPCHHLAFRARFHDWQVWIDAGEQPVPRKLVITYKLQEGQPEFIALFEDFEFSPELDKSTFVPVIPQGAEQIELGGANAISF